MHEVRLRAGAEEAVAPDEHAAGARERRARGAGGHRFRNAFAGGERARDASERARRVHLQEVLARARELPVLCVAPAEELAIGGDGERRVAATAELHDAHAGESAAHESGLRDRLEVAETRLPVGAEPAAVHLAALDEHQRVVRAAHHLPHALRIHRQPQAAHHVAPRVHLALNHFSPALAERVISQRKHCKSKSMEC